MCCSFNGLLTDWLIGPQVMMMGCAVVAELLLSGGADPNARDPSTGGTALHDAARGGFLDTVQTLVRYRADVSVRDNDGKLAADLARENGYVDVVTFLET
ncbi:CDN2B inhibitor, partial [Amia calva]|nr:CDN2B inhibitor [Amia calva]